MGTGISNRENLCKFLKNGKIASENLNSRQSPLGGGGFACCCTAMQWTITLFAHIKSTIRPFPLPCRRAMAVFDPLRVVITNFTHPEVRDIAQARVLLPLQWPLQLLTMTRDCNSCRLLRWKLRIFPRTPAKEHTKCRLIG